jgi:threonylcarbamoyladenosine tRNA methylthiotransferase MtaB
VFFKLYTLGCKVNQYETEYLREGLFRLGYIESAANEIADVVFLNTCAVTSESEAKGRKLARRIVKENHGAELIIFGCSARRDKEQYLRIDGVTKVEATQEWVERFLTDKGLQELPSGISSFGERHRAYVKVQDGCRVGCSYCIIPSVRPILKSRRVGEVLGEVRELVNNNYREIVLTGIHLGHYGVDLSGEERATLAELVERVVAIAGNFRIRLSSLEAVEVSEELIKIMLRNPTKICPHLHLPMQSGNDEILLRMRRRWLSGEYVKCCEGLRERFDKLALTTDVIVGFPSETDEQFEQTCEVIRKLQFSKTHIFRYSPRQGTEAAKFTDQIPQRIILQRVQHLSEIAKKLRENYAASFIGATAQVLFETNQTGTTNHYLQFKTNQSHNTGNLESIKIKNSNGEILLSY